MRRDRVEQISLSTGRDTFPQNIFGSPKRGDLGGEKATVTLHYCSRGEDRIPKIALQTAGRDGGLAKAFAIYAMLFCAIL